MSRLTVVYALQEPPESYTKSIFLAGPTPRDDKTPSWRPEALRLLEKESYDGVVYVPETERGGFHGDWEAQVEWEERCLNLADCIVFWVPRDMSSMPGLTTNIEFGRWEQSGRIVFGAPPAGTNNRYLSYYAEKLSIPKSETLHRTLLSGMKMIGNGATRTAGEREVPLHIWKTNSFQQWYVSLKSAGNRLEHAKQEWVFKTLPIHNDPFFWILHVDIYITKEKRNKVNEIVLSRPDISTIVMYKRLPILDDSIVVLVREFRSPVSNSNGFVLETAGGSSIGSAEDPLTIAAHEVEEETGLRIASTRLKMHSIRQVAATLTAHRAHLFSVELSNEEISYLQEQYGVALGVITDTECTFVELTTYKEVRKNSSIDWAMLGMITNVLNE